MKTKISILAIGFILLQFSLVFAEDWGISITGADASGIGSDHTIHLGTCDGCSDAWEFGEDQYDYPNPFSGEYTNIHFFHLDWYGSVDDTGNVCCDQMEFSTDFRAIHPNNELISWGIRGNTGGGLSLDIPINLSWDSAALDSLSADYELYLYIGDTGYNMRKTNSVSAEQSEFYLDDNYDPNVRILMGACADTGTTTHYFDDDNDGWGGELTAEFCLNMAPAGWVTNNLDTDDNFFCESNLIDDCNVCDGFNLDMDCNGDCFGEAGEDTCGVCSGGNSGHVADSDIDCNEDCFGEAGEDTCGVCSGGNSGHVADSNIDCNGDCFGYAIIDNCENCVSSDFNQNCLNYIFGDGPENVFAQIYDEYVGISWDTPDDDDAPMNSYIEGYHIYYQESDGNNVLLGSTEFTEFTQSAYLDGIFCISAFDQFENESIPVCVQATEMCTSEWNLHPGANLVSLPCIPDDNSVENITGNISDEIYGIIGGGEAAQYLDSFGWVGALQDFDYLSGYWLLIDASGGDGSYDLTGFPPPDDLTYNLPSSGIHLISYQGDDNMSITEALPDDIEPNISNIIGEGNAAIQINGIWYGSLMKWQSGSGYWINISVPVYFSWETSGNQRVYSQNNFTIDKSFPDGFQYTQSTAQAFYFVKEINSWTEDDLNNGWIISYHNNQVSGARKWEGKLIEIPVMGNDGYPFSSGYAEPGDIPPI